ncbi:hypothetical protein AB2M62_15030 [Sphingomonas sp. MMS12-HWE2-04]|uniref:hypothetical protein n=1 Tax=Sphingomonas sp. MMS12-HWE2-04 TaxID=3234199 RepID=UPI00384D28C8
MQHEAITADACEPVRLRRRHDGWTAERQRDFLRALAETGCISEAVLHVGLTTRSAYRLRNHPQGAAFARAWDEALRLGAGKLMTLAYERAIRGQIRESWRDGKLIGQRRAPSDRMLTYLLSSLLPRNHDEATRWNGLHAMAAAAAPRFEAELAGLGDIDIAAELLTSVDFAPPPLSNQVEPAPAPFDLECEW